MLYWILHVSTAGRNKVKYNLSLIWNVACQNVSLIYGGFVLLLKAELRRVQATAAELLKDAQIKKQIAERKVKLVILLLIFIICLFSYRK